MKCFIIEVEENTSKDYFIDELIKAREKCKKVESDSEILTDVEENEKKKRKRKVINYDSDESDQETEKQIKIKYTVLPPPPKQYCIKGV